MPVHCAYLQIWSAPLTVVIALCLVYRLIGVSVFGAVFVAAAVAGINCGVSKMFSRSQDIVMKAQSSRLKRMSEVIEVRVLPPDASLVSPTVR
jgi:hypothetical protein